MVDYSTSTSTSGSTTDISPYADFRISTPGPVPVPAFLNIEGDFSQAYNVTGFAIQHAASAEAFIAKLGDLAAALVPPTINPTFPVNTNAPVLLTTELPELLPIDYSPPQAPQPFSGQLGSLPNFPVFSGQPPQLMFPNAPLPPTGTTPPSPSINTNYSYPTVDVTLPDAPDLISINVQPFNGVTFPTFSASAPTLNLAAPQVIQYLPAAPYTDALLSGLMGEIEQRLSIGITGKNTGLPAFVEANIWARAKEREAEQLAHDVADLDKMEAMGYALPHGAYVDARIKLRTEYAAKSYGFSRDVAIEQAKLEQANIQKAMEIAVSIETKLIDYANQTEQRRFDACRYATEAGVSIYNAGVQAYSARVAGYRAQVEVYTAQIAGARGIVEVYQAQIAAEKLKVDANTAIITEYKTRVDAALASIEVFKGEISIIQTQAQIENLKVSIYGEQIKAFAAEINVYTSQVEAYRAVIGAEETKQQAYATQANVYGTLVEATSKEINAQIETFKAQLAEKQEEYSAFSALVQAQAENVRAIASANTSIAEVYKAEVQGTVGYNEAIVKEWEAINTVATQIGQIGVQAAQAQGQLYLTAKGIATDAAKVGAQVEAQIAASALGTVTWATHRSRQDNVSMGQTQSFGQSSSQSRSYGDSSSTSDTHSYDMLPHTNNNTNQSTSSSTAYNHNIQSVE